MLYALLLAFPFVNSLSFDQYVQKFGKVYSGNADREIHRQEFLKNVALIEAHNKRFDAGEVPYSKGINQFTDVLAEEMPMYKGYSERRTGIASDDQPCVDAVLDYSQKLPDVVDYRNSNPAVLTPVKNQGQCGSCWAFATTETVEAAVAIASGQAPPVLSPQEVTSCTQNPDQCGGTGGCNGATAELGFNQVAQSGLCTNADWPYTQTTGQCNNPCTPLVNITGCAKLVTNNYTDLMYAVAQYGPIAVSVDASQWSPYKSGIYNGCSAEKYYDIDHAVQLVGYGSESGTNYWIVRNSWGSSWGEAGYIRLQRLDPNDKNACKQDVTPGDGVACAGDTDPVTVCGECGIWYDSSFPLGAYYLN